MELANIELADRIISALDEKQLPVSIYMELSKAFDTLDHDTLLINCITTAYREQL